MPIEDTLHDALDEQEDLGDAAARVVDAMRGEIVRLIRNSDSIEDGLQAAAELVADKLAGITTDAVHRGARMGGRLV